MILLLSLIPVFSVSANGYITTGQELLDAVANGGTITVLGDLNVGQSIVVEKDLTINFKSDDTNYKWSTIWFYSDPDSTHEALFVVNPGVTLTLNGDARIGAALYSGNAESIFKLKSDTEKAATLIINNVSCYIGKAVVSDASDDDVKPTFIVNGGSIVGPGFITGLANVTVNAGSISEDVSEYVPSTSYNNFDGFYSNVYKLSENFSESFKKLVNDKGELLINSYEFEENSEFPFGEYVSTVLSMNLSYDEGIEFYQSDAEKAENKACVALRNYNTGDVEYHFLKYVFNYDPETYKEAKKILDAISKNADPESGFFEGDVVDLELMDYYSDCVLGEYNDVCSISYSDEFKNIVGDKPYSVYVDIRKGGNTDLYLEESGGIGMLLNNGTVYGTHNMGYKVIHKMYVPADTANTNSAKKDVLQTRLDRIYGKGKATVTESTYFDVYLYKEFENSYNWIARTYSNPTFEAFKNKEYPEFYPFLPDPDAEDYEQQVADLLVDYLGVENVTFESPAFMIEVNGIYHPIQIETNSSITMPADTEKEPEKEPENGSEQSGVVLVKDDIKAKLEYASDVFPAGTVVKVEQQKQGSIVGRARESLKNVAKKIVVFEITAKSDNVSIQPNGKVKVVFDIPEGFDPAKTVLYYVSEDGKYELIPLTISSDNKTATAELTHFSTYVLSETVASPVTGTNNTLIWLLALAFVSGAAAIYGIKKIKE